MDLLPHNAALAEIVWFVSAVLNVSFSLRQLYVVTEQFFMLKAIPVSRGEYVLARGHLITGWLRLFSQTILLIGAIAGLYLPPMLVQSPVRTTLAWGCVVLTLIATAISVNTALAYRWAVAAHRKEKTS